MTASSRTWDSFAVSASRRRRVAASSRQPACPATSSRRRAASSSRRAAAVAAAAAASTAACRSARVVATSAYSQTSIARHVTGWHSTQETRFQNALDDVASNICAALPRRGWRWSPPPRRAAHHPAPERFPALRASRSFPLQLTVSVWENSEYGEEFCCSGFIWLAVS